MSFYEPVWSNIIRTPGLRHVICSIAIELLLNVLIAGSLAQYQPIQGRGGMINQQTIQQLQTMSSWDAAKSYKRIRVSERSDVEFTYPLIASYVETPELAFTVEEFVVDEDAYPRRRYHLSHNPELEEPPLPVLDKTHVVIENYVRDLGFEDRTTQAMVNALRWKKSHLKGEIPETPDGFYLHNRMYASTAMALLLSLCKNITTLYIGGVGYGTPLQEYLLRSNYGLLAKPGLHLVKNIEIIPSSYGHHDGRKYKSVEFLDYFRYFHRLPSMRTVTMEGVEEYQATRKLFPPGTSNIKRLQIGHADISGQIMSTMIRIPKSLEQFSISQGGLWRTGGGSSMVPLKPLGKALLDHRGTLQVLDLDIDRGVYPLAVADTHDNSGYEEEDQSEQQIIDWWGTEEEAYSHEKDQYFKLDELVNAQPPWADDTSRTRPYGYTIGSFHDFAALTHLSISPRVFLGPAKVGPPPRQLGEDPPYRLIDALPPSLEYLCLYNYRRGENTDIDGHIDELMEKKPERLPLLRTIKGLDELVAGEGSRYHERAEEEELWQRPQIELDWVAV